jgi:hypothetical protein
MLLAETWPGILALILLTCAIIGGALTAFVRLTDRNTVVDTGLIHARVGVAGIAIVLLVMLGGESPASTRPALGLFLLTVMAGVALYFIIRRKGVLPKTIIFIHGVMAATSLAILLFGLPF